MDDYPYYEEQKQAAVKEQNEKAEAKARDYQILFSSEVGLRVLKDLKIICGLNSACYVDNPHRTAFNLGCRNVGLYIKAQIDYGQK